MLLSGHPVCALPILAAFWGLAVEAVDYRRFDGVHRVPKNAQITQPAVLLHERRNDVCGASMKLCPSSLGGDCCPNSYACATNSCYATTKAPSTCGTTVGWHACDKVYGGGCCPDGFICQTSDGCIAPTGSSYAYDCPSSQFLCPSSLGHGCCPDGMACGINRCYSTQLTTMTVAMAITTTQDGAATTFTTSATTVMNPRVPTALSILNDDDGAHETIFKFYPTAIPQTRPSSNHTENEHGNGGNGGLSSAQLGSIIGGAIAFLVLVIAIACVFIRRLNKLADSVEESKKPRPTPPTRQMTVTETQFDDMGAGPRKESQSSKQARNPTPDAQQIHRQGSTVHSHQGIGHYPQVNRDAPANNCCGCDHARSSWEQSPVSPAIRTSNSSWRPVSDVSVNNMSVARAELDSRSLVELPDPSWTVAPMNIERESPPSNDSSITTTRPPLAQQWMRSVGALRRSQSMVPGRLDVVDEEWHGFHGPTDHMAGETAADTAVRNSLGAGGEQDSSAIARQ